MSTQPRRTRPLSRDDIHPAAPDSPDLLEPIELVEPIEALVTPPPVIVNPDGEETRFQRLAAGVRDIRTGGGGLRWNERQLMIIGGVIAPLGVLLVILGWTGAAHTPNLFEQIPYLISGGLLGLALVFLGAFFYFTHWITQLVKEQRGQSAAIVEALGRLETSLASLPTPTLSSTSAEPAHAPSDNGSGPLVATDKGTMAHRPTCVVVAGKSALHAVSRDDGLLPCKLCDPFTDT